MVVQNNKRAAMLDPQESKAPPKRGVSPHSSGTAYCGLASADTAFAEAITGWPFN